MNHRSRAVTRVLRLRAFDRVAAVIAAMTLLGSSPAQAAPTQAKPDATKSPATSPKQAGSAAPVDAPRPLTTPGAAPTDAAKDSVDALNTGTLRAVHVLPLDAIVKHANENAMRVRVSRAKLQLGDASVAGAKPWLPDNPQVYIGAGVRWNDYGNHFELQSTINQPIEVGRERSMRIKAGRRYRELLDKELAQTQWEVYANVHYAYNMALLARERAATAERTLGFSTRLLEVAQRRAQAGEISNLRVRVASGELAQARQARLNADLEYRIACIHLSELSGWPADQLVAPAGNLPAPMRASTATDLISRVQEQHPALRAREAAVTLGHARVSSAQRDRLPEPQVGVYFGREFEPGTGNSNRPSKLALFMFTLPLPLWKRNQAARAQTKAELTVAEQELAATRYSLALSALRAVDALNTAAERVRTYSSEVVPRFQENLNLLQRAFELGEVDILEVFVARENFLRIQNEALDAYRSYFEAEYTLETILGSPLQAIAAG